MERQTVPTSSDPQLSRVFDCTVNGWPKYAKHVPEELRPYHVVADGEIYFSTLLIAFSPQLTKRKHQL